LGNRIANVVQAAQRQKADSALAGGAIVLFLDAVDPGTASVIVSAAAKKHVLVIAYDRLILNTPELAYYVSFDNAAVGALQASALLSAMKGAANPTVVMIHGDPADLEATLLKNAARGALDGKVTVAKEYDTPSGSADGAKLEMTQALAALNNKLDGVYAASDEVAGGAGVPAALVRPLSVTRKTLVTTVIADGFWSRSQLCTPDYAQACKAAGLS